MASAETTPLISKQRRGEDGKLSLLLARASNVESRILFAGFLISLSFNFTQVPMLYVFRLMECGIFYNTHPPFEGPGERCSRDEITVGTATQFSILAMSNTICGTFNLFFTGWLVKKSGPRLAIVIQTFVPALRVAIQSVGVVAGGRTGELIIQCSQFITVIGGPSGYILVINIIAGEVVEPARRTVVFGMLQGALMFGQGLGYLIGGMLGDAINVRAPFDLAFLSFFVSAIYVRACLPYISSESMAGKTSRPKGFLAPLRILVPQQLRLVDGRVKKHLGVIFLCLGIFIGVVATDYAPLLIQQYATAAFDFDQASNGWLMAEFSFMRSFFLLFLFPRIISIGRKSFKSSYQPTLSPSGSWHTQGSETPFPTDPGEFDVTAGGQTIDEPTKPPRSDGAEEEGARFDLVFLRWSLVVDGALTTVAAFATKPWHIYFAAFLLPFGSGSAPAAKGVITGMCPESQRADALNAVTLVENVARLTTLGLFGFVFASLASIGKAYATFFCNAFIAVIGMSVLLLSRFPPHGSTILEQDGEEETDTCDGTSSSSNLNGE